MQIGERNRLKIRHIELHFSSAQFTKCLGDSHYDSSGSKPYKPDPVGGELVKKFFDLLSNGHNLKTLTVKIESHVYPKEALDDTFSHLFDTAPLHRIKTSLMGIQGIQKLDYVVLANYNPATPDTLPPMEVNNDHVGFMEVKTAMEHGWKDRVDQEPTTPWRKPYAAQIARLLRCVEVQEERDRRLMRYREHDSPEVRESGPHTEVP